MVTWFAPWINCLVSTCPSLYSVQIQKPLCLNMFYIIINDAKRKHHNTAFLCFVFFVIISKYRILLVIVIIYLHLFHHGTIIPTGTTCKKISSYIRNSACRWIFVKNVKIFRSYVKHFWTFPRESNCRILIGLCK